MNLSFHTIVVFAITLALTASKATAQESNSDDKIATELSNAVEAFGKAEDDARASLLVSIDELIEKTESNKRLPIERRISVLDEMKAARTSFADDGIVPDIRQLRSSVKNFERALENARQQCIKAYEEAAESYGKSGDLEAAKRVLAELEEFRTPAQSGFNLADGMVFEGRRYQNINGRFGTPFETRLTVRSVKEGLFYGTLFIKGARDDRTYTVEGKSSGSKLEFRAISSENKFDQVHSGVVRDGALHLEFRGVGTQGESVFGKIEATLQK